MNATTTALLGHGLPVTEAGYCMQLLESDDIMCLRLFRTAFMVFRHHRAMFGHGIDISDFNSPNRCYIHLLVHVLRDLDVRDGGGVVAEHVHVRVHDAHVLAAVARLG